MLVRTTTGSQSLTHGSPNHSPRGSRTAKTVTGQVGASAGFTAAYDPDGALVVESHPNGMRVTTVTDGFTAAYDADLTIDALASSAVRRTIASSRVGATLGILPPMTGGVQDDRTDAGGSARSRVGFGLGVLGIVLHCTVIAFYYFALAALVAPRYGQVLLFAVWAGLLALGIRWLRSPVPARSLAIPLLAAGAWFVFVTLGERVLGWQA